MDPRTMATRPLGYAPGQSTGERVLPHQLTRRVHLLTHRARYGFAATAISPGKALDAGCGTGYGSRMLADSGFDVLGVDISDDAIQYARAVYGGARCRFQVVDAQRLDVGREAFDLVTSFEVIEHLTDPGSYLQALHAAVRPHGRLVISTPNRDRSAWQNGRPLNPLHVTEYRPNEFRELLDLHGFAVESWLGQRSGKATRRLARAATAIGLRVGRLRRSEEPAPWPYWWERAAVAAGAPIAARTSWSRVEHENRVRRLQASESDFFVVVARRV